MLIEIPQTEQTLLASVAKAAGYESVQQYVTEHVLALAYQETPALSREELQENLEMCDRSMAQIDAGEGIDAKEAFERLGRERGYQGD